MKMIKVENHTVSIENVKHPFQIIMEALEMLTGVEDALKQIEEDTGKDLTKMLYSQLDDFNKLSDDELKLYREANKTMRKLGLKGELVACERNDEETSPDTSAKSALDKLIKDIIDGQQEL
jgi:hypothetical protein